MEHKLLMVQCYKAQGEGREFWFKKPSLYRNFLLQNYPSMQPWIHDETFGNIKEWPDSTLLKLTSTVKNVAGRFIAGNISTPTKVIDEPATPDLILKELAKDTYTHIGIGIYIDSYSDFIECTKAIRKAYPLIKIIGGNVGSLFPETEKYVDYICKGDGILFLRRLFNEELKVPFKPVIIPEIRTLEFMGKRDSKDLVKIVTKLGCPLKCDFCVTNVLFDGKFSGEMVTPMQVHQALTEYRKSIGHDFQILLCEPSAIISHKWWYDLFELFRNEPGDYPIYTAATALSLQKLDLAKATNSALRLDLANIGIESFAKGYIKNRNIDMKQLIRKLSDYGIGTYATYIVGFDYHNKTNIWEEMKQLVELESETYAVLNLHPLPQTPLWNQLVQEKRLLNVPNDFYYVPGFQSFVHPHFKPGFEDMLPIMADIHQYIEKERGNMVLGMYELLKNASNHGESMRTRFQAQMTTYQMIAKVLFQPWQQFFNPPTELIQRYQSRVG